MRRKPAVRAWTTCHRGGVAVVVGAALLDKGRVLAARRSAPPEVAGGWEFPGGKVNPGESEREALVRECREELGVEVEPLGRLDGEQPLKTGYVLRLRFRRIGRQGLHIIFHRTTQSFRVTGSVAMTPGRKRRAAAMVQRPVS